MSLRINLCLSCCIVGHYQMVVSARKWLKRQQLSNVTNGLANVLFYLGIWCRLSSIRKQWNGNDLSDSLRLYYFQPGTQQYNIIPTSELSTLWEEENGRRVNMTYSAASMQIPCQISFFFKSAEVQFGCCCLLCYYTPTCLT